MHYRLISFDLCPFVQRSVITLKEKNIPFELTFIDLEKPPAWFSKLSPLGKVPVLEVDRATVLFESAVINEYLDETNPPPFHPQDPLRRAHNRAWIEFGSHLLGLQYKMLIAQEKGDFERQRDQFVEDMHHVERQIGDGPLFNGRGFSLVDTAYAPLFMRFALMEKYQSQGLFKDLPKTRRWSGALLERPAVLGSVVEDFEDRFCQHFADSYFGQFLG